MKLFTPLRPDPAARLARANPSLKLASAAVLMAVLFVSVDAVTAAIVLAALAAVTPLSGLRPRQLLARAWPLLLAALSVGLLNALFTEQRGALVELGPLRLGTDSLVAGLGLGLRLLGIAYSGLLAIASTDPTDLADSLVQQARLSPRFAVGALAAVRLLPILADEWQVMSLARRARGVEAGRSPVAAIRLFFGLVLALLVAAVRRGTRLALAMEARGFGALPCRTVARRPTVARGDWFLLAATAGLGLLAMATSLAVGSWRFIFA